MADITLTTVATEVFGGSVLEAYQHRDYISEDWLMFHGMTAGDVINIPVFEEAEGINLADGGSHDGNATITGVQVPLVDPIKAFVDIQKQQVDVRPDLQLLTNTGRALGKAVGYGRTIRIANHLIHEADVASNVVTIDASTGVAATDGLTIKDAIAQVAGEMDEDGVDFEDRYGLIKPTAFYDLRGIPEVISSDFTQGQNRNQAIGGNMALLEYLGFLIRNCGGIFGIDWTGSDHDQKLMSTTTGQVMAHDNWHVIGVFWQKECAAVRHQTGLEANIDWIHRDQVWMPIARLHMGVKVVKAEGVWIIRDQSPT